MSEVADGPETKTTGRPSSRMRPAIRGIAAGRSGSTWSSRDDAEVDVGDEREGSPPVGRAGGEHERARLRDRERAAGERGVEGVELGRREVVVFDHVHAGRPPLGRQRRRDAEPAHAALGADAGDLRRDVCGADAADLDVFCASRRSHEQVDDRASRRSSSRRPGRARPPALAFAPAEPLASPARRRARAPTTRGTSRARPGAGHAPASSRPADRAGGGPGRRARAAARRPSPAFCAAAKRRGEPKAHAAAPNAAFSGAGACSRTARARR